MKIFIGGSLTNANQDLFEMYERIERFCENRDALVYNPSAQYKRLKELNISDYDAYWNCASKFL